MLMRKKSVFVTVLIVTILMGLPVTAQVEALGAMPPLPIIYIRGRDGRR